MEQEKKSNGAFIGLAVIIIILVIGGIYIWQSNKSVPVENTDGVVMDLDEGELNALDSDVSGADTSTGFDVNSIN